MIQTYNVYHDEKLPSHIDRGGGLYIVESAGYIPKELQLRNLMQSGEALSEYYKKVYPGFYKDGEKEVEYYDPTQRKDYDIWDYHDDITYVKSLIEDENERARHYGRKPKSEPEPEPVKGVNDETSSEKEVG